RSGCFGGAASQEFTVATLVVDAAKVTACDAASGAAREYGKSSTGTWIRSAARVAPAPSGRAAGAAVGANPRGRGARVGRGQAIVASCGAVLGFSHYFITPHGFAVGDRGDWAQLLAFITLAVVVGELAARAQRRAREAQESRQEISRLYEELESAFDRASEAE